MCWLSYISKIYLMVIQYASQMSYRNDKDSLAPRVLQIFQTQIQDNFAIKK